MSPRNAQEAQCPRAFGSQHATSAQPQAGDLRQLEDTSEYAPTELSLQWPRLAGRPLEARVKQSFCKIPNLFNYPPRPLYRCVICPVDQLQQGLAPHNRLCLNLIVIIHTNKDRTGVLSRRLDGRS